MVNDNLPLDAVVISRLSVRAVKSGVRDLFCMKLFQWLCYSV